MARSLKCKRTIYLEVLLMLQLQLLLHCAASLNVCEEDLIVNARAEQCFCSKQQPYSYNVRCHSYENDVSAEIELRNTVKINCRSAPMLAQALALNLSVHNFAQVELQHCIFTPQAPLAALLQKFNTLRIVTLTLTQCKFATTFTPQTFTPLTNLRHLKLLASEFTTRQPRQTTLFGELPPLDSLQVNGTQLAHIGAAAFAPHSAIRALDLRDNGISSIDAAAFAQLRDLEELHLGGNNLDTLPEGLLQHNSKLRIFTLANNAKPIRQLPSGIFHNLNALRAVRLSCGLRDIAPNFFANSTRIERLELQQNELQEVPLALMRAQQRLGVLDLSDNRIRSVRNASDIDYRLPPLHWFGWYRSDYLQPPGTSLTIKLDNNPLHCDCHLQWLLSQDGRTRIYYSPYNVRCQSPAHLAGRALYSLQPAELMCAVTANCDARCKCWWRPHDSVLQVNCTAADLQSLPTVPPAQDIELQLSHNNLSALPSALLLPNYEQVSRIDASYNQIVELAPEHLPTALLHLDLQHNHLRVLTPAILAKLDEAIGARSLHSLLLAHNPWSCDAAVDSEHLLAFVGRHLQQIRDFSSWRCTFEHDASSTAYSYYDAISERKACAQEIQFYCLLVVLCCILAVCFGVAIYYRHKQIIKTLLYAHNVCRRRLYLMETQPDDMLYDAYVAYAPENKHYVDSVLIPQLEDGPIPYRLCIDTRDWEEKSLESNLVDWAKTRTEHLIVNSMDQSRRIIVLLTRDFLNSPNGLFSLRMACRGKLTDRRNRVIIVLFGDLGDPSQFNREVQAFLTIHPCFYVGERFFWQKVRYAMPHVIPKGLEPVRMTKC